MKNMRARACQRLYLGVVQVDAVSQCDVRGGEAERIQVSNVALARLFFDQGNLFEILGSVCVNHHTALAREMCDTLQQFSGATDGEARREAVTQAPLSASVPLLKQC